MGGSGRLPRVTVMMENRLSIVARTGWAATGLAAAILLASMWRPYLGWPMVAVVWGTAVFTAVRPLDGLLVLAGIGPIVTALAIVLQGDKAGVHYAEALTLAFIAGAAARHAVSGGLPALPRRILWPAGILIALALASALVNGALLATEQDGPGSAGQFATALVANYLVMHNTVVIALQFAEGLLLFVLVAAVSADRIDARRRVLLMLVAGATGAALLNIVRIVMAALQKAEAGRAMITYFGQARVSVQYSDWNAAGSFFAMTILIALAFAGRRKAGLAIVVAAIGLALWLTGSRVAMAVVLVMVVASAVFALSRPGARQVKWLAAAAIAMALAATVAGVLWYPSVRNDTAMFSLLARLELWKAGVRMMFTDPLFGVGLGRFYDLSPNYADATLKLIWRPHENAHNYFIQVLAELGIPGLVLFVAVAALSLHRGWRAPSQPPPSRLWLTGPLAFLLTCLTGHSFVVPDVTFAFWIALALAAVSGPVPARGTGAGHRRFLALTMVTVALIAALLPMRMRAAVRRANVGNATEGLSAWQAEPGTRYRWAARRATFYVPSGARSIQLRFRAGPDAPERILVRVFLDGREANQVQLQQGDDWRTVRLVQPNRRPLPDYLKIDVETSGIVSALPENDTAKLVLISQPFLVWEK